MKPFPWRQAIGFGLGVLRLPPKDFWSLTPRELALAIAAVKGPVATAPPRAALDALMTKYPDGPAAQERHNGQS